MCVRLQILGDIIDWNRTFDLEDGGMAGHDLLLMASPDDGRNRKLDIFQNKTYVATVNGMTGIM